MTFFDTFLKAISYYSDSEDPLHSTDFIMEWDGLSDDEKKNYVKAFIAGLSIVLSAAAFSLVLEDLLDYIEKYKDVLKKAGEETAKKTLASEVKRIVGVDDRQKESKKILNELDEILNCDLADEFIDRENMREPFKTYFNTLFNEEEQKKIIIEANYNKSERSRDLFERKLRGWIKGRMLASKVYEHNILN